MYIYIYTYIHIYIYVANMRFFNVNFCKPPVKSVNRCRLRRDEAVPTPRSLWSSGSRTGRSGLGTQDVLRNPAGKADEFSVIFFSLFLRILCLKSKCINFRFKKS